MNNFLNYLDNIWLQKKPIVVSVEEGWEKYCNRYDLKQNDKVTTMQRITFDDFDMLQREFTSKSILKCIACKSDHVDWRSVQTCRADEAETIFAECKDCKKKWRFR